MIVRLGRKSLPWTNTSLLRKSVIYEQKKFYNIGPRVEVNDTDKHSSLLRQGIDYGRKTFNNTGRIVTVINFFSSSQTFYK